MDVQLSNHNSERDPFAAAQSTVAQTPATCCASLFLGACPRICNPGRAIKIALSEPKRPKLFSYPACIALSLVSDKFSLIVPVRPFPRRFDIRLPDSIAPIVCCSCLLLFSFFVKSTCTFSHSFLWWLPAAPRLPSVAWIAHVLIRTNVPHSFPCSFPLSLLTRFHPSLSSQHVCLVASHFIHRKVSQGL